MITTDKTRLEISALNYRSKALELRKIFLFSMTLRPEALTVISKRTGIKYRTLLNFYSSKTSYMSYKDMIHLKKYVDKIMNLSWPDTEKV